MQILALLILLLGQAASPAPTLDAPQRPASSAWSAEEIEVLPDERASLRGISRLAVAIDVPAELAAALPAAPLQSMVAFRLEQAGMTVVATRELDDPLLSIAIHAVVDSDAPGVARPVAYTVSADVMQLVRLRDDARRARFMQASTWQVSDPSAARPSDIDRIRERVAALIDVFLADYRAVNRPRPAVPEFRLP